MDTARELAQGMRPQGRNGNGTAHASNHGSGDDLDARILGLEKAVGTALFGGILREYGRVNQPKLIRDAAMKRKVLKMLESATRGLDRLDAASKRSRPRAADSSICKTFRLTAASRISLG